MTDAHDQAVTHHYTMHYPPHPPRQKDPHYRDFEAWKRRNKANAACAKGLAKGDFSECHGGLEAHHAHIEFALQQGVSFEVLERYFPGISNPNEVGEWIETDENLQWLCEFHHRGHGGVHVASSSDYEAETFVKGLIS